MKRRMQWCAGMAMLLSSVATFYFFTHVREEDREIQMLADAYDVRMNYEASSRLYAQLLGSLRLRRHEALYNLGNVTKRQGREQKNFSLLLSALEYYKEALRQKPDFLEAKKNFEITQSLIDSIEASEKSGRAAKEGKESEMDIQQKENQEKRKGQKPGLVPYVPSVP